MYWRCTLWNSLLPSLTQLWEVGEKNLATHIVLCLEPSLSFLLADIFPEVIHEHSCAIRGEIYNVIVLGGFAGTGRWGGCWGRFCCWGRGSCCVRCSRCSKGSWARCCRGRCSKNWLLRWERKQTSSNFIVCICVDQLQMLEKNRKKQDRCSKPDMHSHI